VSEFIRKTAISWVENERIVLRGYAIEDLIGRVSWGAGLFLLLVGELPPPNHARLLEAISISVIDHGVSPPSTIAAVTAANTGASLNAAVAAGMLAINKFHGGAIEDAMSAISAAVRLRQVENLTAEQAAQKIADEYKQRKERISGFGHRFHAADPRAIRLFDLARELNIAGEFVEQAEVLAQVLCKATGKHLPVNADGAIAALLLEMRFPPRLANGIFIIARCAGLLAHAAEEQERNPPMRTVKIENYQYDGQPRRNLTEK
jgi:citrate synthase